jgi:Ran GTPase-activating protein (RanGAP) involved in mRNA processing and transport
MVRELPVKRVIVSERKLFSPDSPELADVNLLETKFEDGGKMWMAKIHVDGGQSVEEEHHLQARAAGALMRAMESDDTITELGITGIPSRNGRCGNHPIDGIAEAISNSLVMNSCAWLKTLGIGKGLLSDKGATLLAEGLGANTTLKELRMECLIERHGLGTELLGQALAVNSSLKTLNLAHSNVPEGAAWIANGIKTNSTLEILNMGYNPLIGDYGNDALDGLGQALAVNSSLKKLDLTYCLASARAVTSLAEGLKTNTTLEILDLKRNVFSSELFGGDVGEALETALSVNSSLRTLDLTNCHLDSSSTTCLGRGLRANTTLEVLRMGQNLVGSIGASAFVEAMGSNVSLKTLELTDCKIDCKIGDAIKALAVNLILNTKMMTLKMAGNDLRDAGARLLGCSLGSNSCLLHLDLSRCKICDGGATGLASGLVVNTTLETLGLKYNRFGSEGALALGTALGRNWKSNVRLDVRHADGDLQGVVHKAKSDQIRREKLQAFGMGLYRRRKGWNRQGKVEVGREEFLFRDMDPDIFRLICEAFH